MYIEIMGYSQDKQKLTECIREIFFLTTTKAFNDESEKEPFFYKYAGIYLENWPDDVFLARELETHKPLGYIIGCRDSAKAQDTLNPLLASYDLFSDLFKKYPAHFHINTHLDYQGRGVGTFLLGEYLLELKKARVKGVHLITAPNERNVQFYWKHNFRYRVEREFQTKMLLFMGRRI